MTLHSPMNPPDIATAGLPESHSLIRAFHSRVSRSPDRTAVVSGNDRITFKQLGDLSDRIASALVSEGIGKGDFVGIGLPRSIGLIASLLGVLKSGAAYIPVDPGYPAARIAHMVGSSGLRKIVTTSAFASSFAGTSALLTDQLPETPHDFTPAENDPEDLIYAIFTSGSTGLAKAASVRHKGFGNLVRWYVDELSLTESDTTLVISSPSFDLTQKNFFAPLVTGGTLVLDSTDNYDIHRITSLIGEHGVTLVNCTPSAFYPLVDATAPEFSALSSLRFAVLGGEPILVERLRDWLTHASCRAEVVNSYGPTECADICAFHRMHRDNLDAWPFVPTGKEIPNVTVTIRDEQLGILPDGELGELCIEGIGVGGGYVNDPGRTEERFIGGVYKTGDLARRGDDGVIEFRGRADHQVKVNGFRIELGEIEIALGRHPLVTEAIVTAADNRLTAHVQGNTDAASLKDHLAGSLPSYMIPAEFLFIENFPLTPNGKIDRKALSTPGDKAAVTTTDDGSLESRILALWSEILQRPVSDPTANFFDIGGTSIHLAVVHVRLRAMTEREIAITDLFANPSARSLAAHLSPSRSEASNAASQDRARLQQAGFSAFRRPARR